MSKSKGKIDFKNKKDKSQPVDIIMEEEDRGRKGKKDRVGKLEKELFQKKSKSIKDNKDNYKKK